MKYNHRYLSGVGVMFIELEKSKYGFVFDYVMDIPFNMLMARSVILDHVDGNMKKSKRLYNQTMR